MNFFEIDIFKFIKKCIYFYIFKVMSLFIIDTFEIVNIFIIKTINLFVINELQIINIHYYYYL